MPNNFRLIDVARAVVDEIIALTFRAPRLLFDAQLRDAADSITSNIREAYGRRPGAERHQFFRYAHGSAEETDEHLRANFAAGRLGAVPYWRLHNRLVVIMRMLASLMTQATPSCPRKAKKQRQRHLDQRE
jgi:four helix bundle protein